MMETPSAGELSSSSNDADFRFQDEVQTTGQPAIVVRDVQGRVVYPGYIPQAIRSLVPGDPSRPLDHDAPPPHEGPRKAATDPSMLQLLPEKRTRPAIGPKFNTDTPRRGSHRGSAMPVALKRAGTNVSQLQQELWQRQDMDDEDSSTSDSSTDDDDDDLGAGIDRTDQQARQQMGDRFRRFRVGNDNYKTTGKVSKRDGRLAISIKDTSNKGYLAKALGTAVSKVVPLKSGKEIEGEDRPIGKRTSSETSVALVPCPRLNIVIMVIGSRGDAQPFIQIGKVLKSYGHRVRFATHPAFRQLIEKDCGLDFFSIGGDPSELMAFMVKNPGMIPTLETVRAGDISRRRTAMREMFEGFWRACINATDDESDVHNLKMMGNKDPFVADAIIANPPSFAHVHCAEALGIPLHLMFTFPYTPTQAFPHPLASIKKSNVDPGYTNFISYPLVEMMVWQGLGDLVNDFRVKTLGLDPVSTLWAPGATYRLHVPFTYLWSPGLVPKPQDWGDEIDISGFVFLDLASSFKPPNPLVEFLNAGEMPIYIGFGSIVVDDAEEFTEMIFEAVKLAGVRALVSEGWGGLGGENVPDNIFMLDNTPHDWLFPKVKACVIHGGAGTTAIALKCGKPTMVVPFFGDQHFWGAMLARAKAGPEPVPYKILSAEKLAEGIKYCLTEEAQQGVDAIARGIAEEGAGAENAVDSFHKHLVMSGKHSMRCSILEDRVSCWAMKNSSLRLSALAADILVEKGHFSWKKLRLIRHQEWNDFEGPGEPVTGVAGSIIGSFGEIFGGLGGVPARLAKTTNKRRERKEKHRLKHEEKRKLKAAKSAVNASAQTTGQTAESSLQDADGAESQADEHANHNADRASVTTGTTTGMQDNMAEEYANDVGTGVGKAAQAVAQIPLDLSMALAQGFHNAPRLYGDDTVRRPPRVTGISSGLKAAGHEFVFGIYDGWTGVVRLPIRGARNGGGPKGFVKGVGMGLTGFVLKDLSAVFSPFSYTLKGIKKQVERRKQPTKRIRRARIVEGQRHLWELSEEEREAKTKEVLKGWEVMRALSQVVDKKVKDEGGFQSHSLILGARRRKDVGNAFESVQVAEQTLEAVQRGEPLHATVKEIRKSSEEKGRRSQDSWRVSSDKRRMSQEKAGDTSDNVPTKMRPTVIDEGDETNKPQAASDPLANGKS